MTTINGQPVVVDPSDPGAVVVNGQTIHAGDPGLTISGTPISLGAGSIILGTQTIPLTSPTQVTIAGQTYTLTPGQPLVISGTTIFPGGPAATISGTPISLAAGGLIIAGSSTLVLPTAAASAPAQGALITLGGAAHTASEGANGAVVIDGTTLTPGGPAATISGTVVSAAADGLVVGGRTVAYSGPAATEALVTAADGAVLTATRLADGTVRVGGQVLSVGGPAVTVDGVVLSLGPQGVVMGTAAGGTAFGGTRTVGWVTLTGTGGFGKWVEDEVGLERELEFGFEFEFECEFDGWVG
ncbi:hypothetical protein GTA08_BOTSDO02055 [Neofusicoccum parvum]|uniref:Uncharacterized protein n=1 Tax=Neofusicoccum parvum TaxID=310453 RepID=A0ACB5S411_9PEZI|nr:hypothetical protein GTA08_BOTSDO02055 [Neofusicoccum parvum]